MTSGKDDGCPNRRLTDFVLHDENGVQQPLEMLEVDDMFIFGLILPLEESLEKEKEKVIIWEGFGWLESWDFSSYEDGSPVIWLSTEIADYHCLRPASSYASISDYLIAEKLDVKSIVNQMISGNALSNTTVWLLREQSKE